jgi:hypothetical protein
MARDRATAKPIEVHDRVRPFALVVRLAVCILLSVLLVKGGRAIGDKPGAVIGFVISVPAWAIAFARPLVELASGIAHAARMQPLRRWQGRYYAFDGVHIRVFEEDDRLYFAARDIATALHLPRGADAFLATQPDGTRVIERLTCLDADAVEAWMGTIGTRDAGRLAHWMRQEVEAPWRRKRENASA